MIHSALHGTKLECVEEGDDLSSDCSVILLEHQVSQLDQQQNGKCGHLAVDLGNRPRFTLKKCLKVPKRENFSLAFFALSEPIWVCDLGSREKNRFFLSNDP